MNFNVENFQIVVCAKKISLRIDYDGNNFTNIETERKRTVLSHKIVIPYEHLFTLPSEEPLCKSSNFQN